MNTLLKLVVIGVLIYGYEATEDTTAKDGEIPQYKVGLLAPWTQSFDDFSALTSASAISMAIEAIHADPTLNTRMKFR